MEATQRASSQNLKGRCIQQSWPDVERLLALSMYERKCGSVEGYAAIRWEKGWARG